MDQQTVEPPKPPEPADPAEPPKPICFLKRKIISQKKTKKT